MSNFINRQLLICVIPTVVVLLSAYWYRRKKKLKQPAVEQNSHSTLSSDTIAEDADTLSDASSLASPTSSDKSSNNQNIAKTLEHNHNDTAFHKTSVTPAIPKKTAVNNRVQNAILKSEISQQNGKVEDLKKDLKLTGEFEYTVVNCNHAGLYNNYVDNFRLPLEVDVNDSHSSVLDENSLSDLSDTSDKQPVENKDSPSSVLDEGSLHSSMCEDLVKSLTDSTKIDFVDSKTDIEELIIPLHSSLNQQSLNRHIINGEETVCGRDESKIEDARARLEVGHRSVTYSADGLQVAYDPNSTDSVVITNELTCSEIQANSMDAIDTHKNCNSTNSLNSFCTNDRLDPDKVTGKVKLSSDDLSCGGDIITTTGKQPSESSHNIPATNVSELLPIVDDQASENSATPVLVSQISSRDVINDSETASSSQTKELAVTDSKVSHPEEYNSRSKVQSQSDKVIKSCDSPKVSKENSKPMSYASAVSGSSFSEKILNGPSTDVTTNGSPMPSGGILYSDKAKSGLETTKKLSPDEVIKDGPISSKSDDSSGPTPVDEKNLKKEADNAPSIPERNISAQLKGLTRSQPNSSNFESQEEYPEVVPYQSKMYSDDLPSLKISNLHQAGSFVYEFELPQEFCGRLIGRRGQFIKSVQDQMRVRILIKGHPYDPLLKTVIVEGARTDVMEAMELIRHKYPSSRFPTVSLVQTNSLNSANVTIPEYLQLHIPEGASCDVILSSLISAGHFFLQQPTHPTYPNLSTLDSCMRNCYSQLETPFLPHPVESGVVCAAPVQQGWYRAQVLYVSDNATECFVKFVDYGGFQQLQTSSLRQIRSDFMSLPFQASECYLANVHPVGRDGWSSEATAAFEELAQGQILQALLVEYAENGIPCVQLYRVQGITSTFINKELVERGHAVWVPH